MEVTLTLILICCLAFFVAGCIDSIAGGGGLITTPTLLMLGVPAHFCLGSTKLASMCGSSVALFTFWQNKQIIGKVALLGAISSFAGGVLGSWIALSIDNQKMTLIMVGLIPVGLAISLISGTFKIDKEVEDVQGWRWKAVLIGLTVGMYEGFVGPGAGSLGAVCTFATAGTVAYSLAIPCAAASILGNRIGAKYAIKIGPNVVRKALYLVITLLMITLIFKLVTSNS